ncbi:hypothetical protein A33Q_0897 [Indibacter alkaliphilus LW1]|uniref:Uncharacterized protein n=1 Tax=Indibacter alkaliphilus (strain CCUG 57479 / KCTC 22604 / LW1) TaxID=1189612 RepID=S2DIP2_INDAL|nr:hypothetical protein A33Q_0897 [Indibacter alkaliphilus LW1]
MTSELQIHTFFIFYEFEVCHGFFKILHAKLIKGVKLTF